MVFTKSNVIAVAHTTHRTGVYLSGGLSVMKHKTSKSDQERSESEGQSTRTGETDRGSGGSNTQESRVEALQRSVGNQGIQRRYRNGHLPAKPTVSQPDDEDEREAEQVAKQVMRSSATGSVHYGHADDAADGPDKSV